MKKIKVTLVVLLAVLVSSLSANAKFGIGPKVGVNINKLSFSGKNVAKDLLSSDNRAGFNVGLTAEYIAPVLGLGADISLMYAYQSTTVGYNFNVPGMGSLKDSEKIHGSFFEIPLHLKYKLSIPAAEKIVAPYLYTGPSVAFKLSGGDSYGSTKKTQWGWDLGLGLQLIQHLQIGAGYTFGINKVAGIVDGDLNTSGDIKVKSNYWSVTAAWMF